MKKHQAYKIATAGFVNKKGEYKNLTPEAKIRYLRLPRHWQTNLAVLVSASVKTKIKNDKAKQHKTDAKIAAIKVESKDIREKLEKHAAKSCSRMKTIDVYVNVWEAIQYSGGDRSQLNKIIDSYKKLTRETIGKPLLRVKIAYLEKSGIIKRV